IQDLELALAPFLSRKMAQAFALRVDRTGQVIHPNQRGDQAVVILGVTGVAHGGQAQPLQAFSALACAQFGQPKLAGNRWNGTAALCRLAEAGGGLRELLKLIMSVALPLLQLGRGIALSAGLSPEFESLAGMPEPKQRCSTEEPGQSEIGLEAQGALEAAKRLGVLMEIIELDHAQLEMRLGIVGALEGLAPPELPI